MRLIYLLTLFLTIPNFLFSQNVVTEESLVEFKISNMGINSVKGTISGMTGEVFLDEKNIENSRINICLEVATIQTKNKGRDKHLKKEDFFDIENFPNICFTSKTIEKFNGKFIAKGILQIKNRKKEVEIPFTFNSESNEIIGNFSIKRTDFGVGPKGGFMVGKTVEITKVLCKLKS
ncbi:YceI family protein [Aureivirga marina]|uniref:YceI family protein n=1 Tax=Aureivirga marina TaxID=1182451 RepID=UPI0018C9D89A|nr:YceI family protein [Aureivirga marina]